MAPCAYSASISWTLLQVWAGSPAKMLRQLTSEEAAFVAASADNYAKLALDHRCGGSCGQKQPKLIILPPVLCCLHVTSQPGLIVGQGCKHTL